MNWKKWVFGLTVWISSLVWVGFETSPWVAGAIAGVSAGIALMFEAEE